MIYRKMMTILRQINGSSARFWMNEMLIFASLKLRGDNTVVLL
ncbi:hypothetical protein BROOK1789C_794 [Bathymodiolus brooksi thiotrophic gill symbiont]|nr:hypothetical protein BROOK1789C_794 [Bathymodiolus brooksi thiotrophic gill symbiont]